MTESKKKVSQAPVENTKPAVKKESFTAKLKRELNDLNNEHAELKKKFAELKAKYSEINADVEKEVEKRTRQRIADKDKYIAHYEDECDAKIDNLNVIISGLHSDLERANREIDRLRSSSKNLTPKKGLFERLFGSK